MYNGATGPYASAILRFQIRFPPAYPNLPPLVTFTTDIFHPLIVPLTTYTFTTGSSTEDPVSATDEERLPPGGFSLRHGFPHWFGRAKRSAASSNTASRNVSGGTATYSTGTGGDTVAPDISEDKTVDEDTNDGNAVSESAGNRTKPTTADSQRISSVPSTNQFTSGDAWKIVPVAELLDYIRSTFDDETILDSLPLEAAGNPGAWHAWKAHRRDALGGGAFDAEGQQQKKGSPQARLPGEWHWDGIWERRVEKEIEASRSDAILYGNAARGTGIGDDSVGQPQDPRGWNKAELLTCVNSVQIRFSRLDDATLASIKELVIPRMEEVQP